MPQSAPPRKAPRQGVQGWNPARHPRAVARSVAPNDPEVATLLAVRSSSQSSAMLSLSTCLEWTLVGIDPSWTQRPPADTDSFTVTSRDLGRPDSPLVGDF